MANRIWIGLIFVIFGTGFLMHQAEIIDFTHVLAAWWPLILIIIGVIQLINRTSSSSISGMMFILVGGLFLVNQLFDFNLTAYIWPIIIIFIGLVFMFTRVKYEAPPHTDRDLNNFLLFAGTEVRSQSKNFRGGSVTAIFGGAEIDLREVVIAKEGATLDLTAIFGGIELTVPENVQVEVSGIPIFGGWEDKTRARGNDDDISILKINGMAVFGGVEIKN